MIYNSLDDTWRATRPMIVPRVFPQSITLTSGKLLVAGGIVIGSSPPKTTNSVEIYDPRTNTWREVAPLSKGRFAFKLVPFSKTYHNRQIAAISGFEDWDGNWTAESFVPEIEVFDPVAEQWHTIEELPNPGAFSTVTQLEDGRIWVAGGQIGDTVTDTSLLIQVLP
jgi:N-acetylneuraminic acid mutarotase